MEINNKYNLGDTVYHPGVDLRASKVFKGEVSGIVLQRDEEGVDIIAYQVGQPYAVVESDLFTTPELAIERLVEILDEKKEEIAGDIDEAIVKIQESNPEDITYDLTAQYEDTQEVVAEPVQVLEEGSNTTK